MLRAFAAIPFFASLAFASIPAMAQTVIGEARSIETAVTGNDSREINEGSEIYANELIRSNETGVGHFELLDGTKLVLGPEANLLLDELVYDPSTSAFEKVVLNASSGATRFITGRSDSSAFTILTPVGALGVRGTAFDLRHWRGRTYVMLLEGNVEICNANGECDSLSRKCDFVVVGRDGRISNPVHPRQGIFGAFDMARYFPFVNDQSQIKPSYQLSINTCSGGNNGSRDSGAGGTQPSFSDNAASSGSSGSSGNTD